MTAITKKEQEEKHEAVDKAIQESLEESPASVNEIARKTGNNPMLVLRRFVYLGYRYKGGRWVYRHNEGKK